MKTLLTLLFISVCSLCVAQSPYKQIADQNNIKGTLGIGTVIRESNDIEIKFSKGEAFTEKEWQDYLKQIGPIVKQFYKRDSAHQKFISNTAIPHLIKGDTVESFNVTLEGIDLKLKPKKK